MMNQATLKRNKIPDLKEQKDFESFDVFDAKNPEDGPISKNLPYDLAEVLRKPLLRSQFKEFLHNHVALENMMFFEHIEMYQKIDKPAWRQKTGRQMVLKYVHADGQFQVNLSSEVKQRILEARVFTKITFDDAKREVYNLMQDNFFDKFLSSLMQREEEQPQEEFETPKTRRPSTFFKRASQTLSQRLLMRKTSTSSLKFSRKSFDDEIGE